MNSKNKDNKTLQSLSYLINKSHENSTFKAKFLENPYNTIKDLDPEFSLEDGKEIIVEDQSKTDVIYINIPKQPNLEELELTDEQLEMVSGGTSLLLLFVLLGDGITININTGDTYNNNIQIGDNNQNG